MIIEQAIVISFIVIAIWATMLENMIFGRIRDIKMPDWVAMPLYDCPICQSAWYGSVIYCFYYHNGIIDWLMTIGVAMGIATIFVKIKRN